MESIIAFFCIFGLCIFVYGYIMMRHNYKEYSHKCNILYVPRHSSPVKDRLPHMEVVDHEEHDSRFLHTRFSTAPRGISEIDSILPSLNRRYDSIELIEMGG